MSELRVLLTTDTVGGVWTFTRELTEGLLAEGCSVVLVSFGPLPSPQQRMWCDRTLAAAGERFFFASCDEPLEWMQENERTFTHGLTFLREIVDHERVELLHASQFCWGALPGTLPRIVTAHSDVLSWAVACNSDALRPSPWLTRYRDLVQKGIAGADVLTFPTRWMQQAFGHHSQVRGTERVISNGRTVKSPARARRLQAVTVGRLWDEAKGLGTLTDLAVPMPILVAGESAFEGKAAGNGSLQSLGVLDEDTLLEVFAESSVYIASSIYEPFGLAPLEAAMCGCAVVARDIQSLREVWADGALYFDSGAALEEILRKLAEDGEALAAARVRSQRRAELFSGRSMTLAYLELYREVLARPERNQERQHAA